MSENLKYTSMKFEDLNTPMKFEDLNTPMKVVDLNTPMKVVDLNTPMKVEDLNTPMKVEDLNTNKYLNNYSSENRRLECRIFELRLHNRYRIIDFGKLSKDKYYILAIETSSNIINDHYEKYYISKECYDVLNKYFIIRGGKIICGYNGKIYNDLSLILHVGCTSQTGITSEKLVFDLSFMINDNLSFTFYINHYKEFNLSRLNPYTFDCILIVNKNLILGNEGIYYHDISYYKDYILNNIDKDILTKINNSKNSETLNIYTHILNRSRKCKLEINNSIDSMRSNKHIYKVSFSTNNEYNKFDITKLSISNEIFKYNKYPKSKEDIEID